MNSIVGEGGSPLAAVNSQHLVDDKHLPSHEAIRLLAAVTGRSGAELRAGVLVEPRSVDLFHHLADRRASGTPLQYLEGTVSFGPIELLVDSRALIPRPETEQLWETAIGQIPLDSPFTVVDLGTGSGCLALAIAHERPRTRVVACDISPDALDLARLNAFLLDLPVEFFQGDRLSALPTALSGRIDLIVTNPPYISESEWPGLPEEVRDHEPRIALVAGDGLREFRYLASHAPSWLVSGGGLAAEIGDGQGQAILRLFSTSRWAAEIRRDLAGRERFLIARLQT
ncbi:MAG: peptide chain release factor N(5)-glutamine methyltransferase [bacterium]|nr:peptide chain release factor N(5)-glutamine methyltransferase [bacterium]